ncbi:MAG: hypothetical protein QXJ80_07475 [Nitrososphaerota archaeon]
MLREITRDIADVSSASSAVLLRELIKLYGKGVPKSSDVVNRLEEFFRTAMMERRLAEANMAAALLRRLQWLVIDEQRTTKNVMGSDAIVIYDLSEIHSVYLKTLYALTVFHKNYYEAMREGLTNRLTTLLVAEECQNYVHPRRFDEPPSLGERVVNELRGYGVGVLMISPDPLQIPIHLPRDVGAVACFGAQAVPDFIRDMLRVLPRQPKMGEAIVYHNGRIKTARPPKRPPKTIDLKTETKEVIEEAKPEEAVETPATIQQPQAEDAQTNPIEQEEPLEEAQRGSK